MSAAILTGPSRGARGTNVLDVREGFNAVPGPAGAAATRAAIQAAVDYCDPNLPGATPGLGWTIKIPGGDWYVDGPVIVDFPHVTFAGDGPGVTTLTMASGLAHSPLVFGFLRRYDPPPIAGVPQPPVVLDATRFVDAFGKLDASMAPAPARRWGYRLGADTHLAFPLSPFSHGPKQDYWGGTRALTVEFAFDPTPPTPNNLFVPLMGMSEFTRPMPWCLYFQAGNVYLQFATQDGTPWGTTRACSIPIPTGGTGLVRVAVQVDLDGAQVSAFANGLPATPADTARLAGPLNDWNAGAGLRFVPNPYAPFLVGADGSQSNITYVGRRSLTIYGLKVSDAIRYATVGGVQAPVGGGTVNDYSAYGTDDATTVARLQTDTAPATIQANRVVPYQASIASRSFGTGSGYWMDAYHGSHTQGGTIHGLGVRDMTVNCQSACCYGAAVLTATTFDFEFRDVVANGGNAGLGTMNATANYIDHVRGTCQLSAHDAPLARYFGIVDQSGKLDIIQAGRSAIRSSASTDLNMTGHVNVMNGNPQYVVYANNITRIGHLMVDYEGGNDALIAAIFAEASPGQPISAILDVGTLEYSLAPPTAVLIHLHESPGTVNGPARLKLGTLLMYGDHLRAIVETTGTTWQGTFRVDLDVDTPAVINSGPGGVGSVVSEHHAHVGPPRRSTWSKHSHRLVVDRPVDGQYHEWRCASTGTYGSATPPGWYGLDPLDLTGAGLAAYVTAHMSWAGGGSIPHPGMYTDYAATRFLNRYFGGAAQAPPAGLYLALSYSPEGARRDGNFQEYAGNGYARVPIAFGASVAGAASTNAAATFGAATAAGYDTLASFGTSYPATALVLCDASAKGNALAQIPIDPLPIAVGTAPSFAAGTIRVAPAAVPGAGLVATAAYDAMNALWLSRQAITPPTLSLALSTAAASLSAPAEPTGGGYARVPLPAWSPASAGPTPGLAFGWSANAAPIAFATPTGPWGTPQSLAIVDAAGNVVLSGNLTIKRAVGPGSPAPTVVAGALWANFS